MITSQEYINNTGRQRDLLAAFSAMDHSVTEPMSQEEIEACFQRLLFRLLAIIEIHGPGASARFMQALEEAGTEQTFATILEFVELGKKPGCDLDRDLISRRELQQEILHFSRIVDLQDSLGNFANKRLRNSKLIPEPLKVLCEFQTLARARILQRGKAIPCPRPRPDQQEQLPLGGRYLLVRDQEPSDYLLIISGGGSSVQRDLAYLFSSLLTYLTPYEGLYTLVVHIMESSPRSGPLSLHLLEPPTGNRMRYAHWHAAFPERPDGLLEGSRLALPMLEMRPLDNPIDVSDLEGDPLLVKIHPEDSTGLFNASFSTGTSARFSAPEARPEEPGQMVERALRLFKARCTNTIQSIESGHIHLDRQIDEDQGLGLAIGYQVYSYLNQIQAIAPRLCPMVDDDHVLVQLSAQAYEDFFCHRNPGASYELIPESSPIVRSIACALVACMQENPSRQRFLSRQGGNLLLRVPEGNILCELFEDYDGKCDTGCVLFEVALLIYRSDPVGFTTIFNKAFNVQDDVHRFILSALDPQRSHDEIVGQLRTYMQCFREATNPRHPFATFKRQVSAFLASQEQVHIHLNVLEDYYEAQQFKVRKLLRFFGIPIHLWSLHFNRMTGRVHLERRAHPREE